MNQTEQILSQLRDIGIPPAPDGVSIWIVAANLALLLMVLVGFYRHWRRERERWRRAALKQVIQARSLQPASAVLALAKLLRQIMLYRQCDISAVGQAWLFKLDAAFNTHWFSQAEGQAFGSALYRNSTMTVEEQQRLCKQLEQLIRKLPAHEPRATRPQDGQSPS